jgi:hypothetical protein
MVQPVTIDPREITITPVFMHIELENIPKSEAQGRKVMELKEVVEVRFAGSKTYSPRFPTDEMWKREGMNVITYAERWPEQYRAFKEGNPQEANGTPLEMLRPFGVTPEQLSLCRALKIYSIEALHALEGPAFKSLGMSGNSLREAAKAFIAQRSSGDAAMDEIAALRAKVAELEARSTIPPAKEATPAEIAAAIETADDAFAELTDSEIKDEIAKLAGERPRGNPNRQTLVSMLESLTAG